MLITHQQLAHKTCRHCGNNFGDAFDREKNSEFCCSGCETVFNLLNQEGLEKYYQLSRDVRSPATVRTPSHYSWLQRQLETAKFSSTQRIDCQVQGIQCAACVWLIEELYRRSPNASAGSLRLNPATGNLTLQCDIEKFDVSAFFHHVETFGYQVGPASETQPAKTSTWGIRFGICAALTLNVMLFSVSFYFGLSPDDSRLFTLFERLSVLLSTVVVIVGGTPFFRSALRGLKNKMLHLDAPIAVGIAAVYFTSLVQWFSAAKGTLTYFDTLNVFVTLMLLGRMLQEFALLRSRRFLLEDDGLDALWVRRIRGARLDWVKAEKIQSGETLSIANNDLIPVDAVLLSEHALISTEWLSGESASHHFIQAQALRAGSFNVSNHAIEVKATGTVRDGALPRLLRTSMHDNAFGKKGAAYWQNLSKNWSIRILLIAALGFLAWLPFGSQRALSVAVSLLVVTCPCAVGIAIPLAYQLSHAALRRKGFYVRSEGALDAMAFVRRIVFDKTGTLSLGRLEVFQSSAISQEMRNIAFTLASASSHPKSQAIAKAIASQSERVIGVAPVEVTGVGVEAMIQGDKWRLGKANTDDTDVRLTKNEVCIATFSFSESARPGARNLIQSLRNEGYLLMVLSGDAQKRVESFGARYGFQPDELHSNLSPEAKCEVVKHINRSDVLYLGDGVNDALAFEAATVAGTPAIERPVMPRKSDFFIVGASLEPLKEALHESHRLRRTVRVLVRTSVAYNVLVVAACLAGLMTPVIAAVVMPLSTLSLIGLTLYRARNPRGEGGA